MSLGEFHFRIDERLPVLKVHGDPRPKPAVVVLHGLGAPAEVQRAELYALAQAGLTAVGVDAPHHGQRRDAWLDEQAVLGEPAAHARMLQLLLEWVPEVSRVVDHLEAEAHGPIAVLGISMGAYAALKVACADARVAATVSILGSPDWAPVRGEVTDEVRASMAQAPLHTPDALKRAPVYFFNAGLDGVVPPRAAREFAEAHQLPYAEYPESEHLMRPDDWHDVWRRALAFLRRQPGFVP